MFSDSYRYNMHTGSSTRLAAQHLRHAHRGPLRTDTCTACARVRHARLIYGETVRILVSISAVSPEKTRRQTVRAEVLRPPPLSIANVRICIFQIRQISYYALELQRDLYAVPITGTGIIYSSSKGVSQGGSAACAASSKNGNIPERCACVSDRCVRWIDHR